MDEEIEVQKENKVTQVAGDRAGTQASFLITNLSCGPSWSIKLSLLVRCSFTTWTATSQGHQSGSFFLLTVCHLLGTLHCHTCKFWPVKNEALPHKSRAFLPSQWPKSWSVCWEEPLESGPPKGKGRLFVSLENRRQAQTGLSCLQAKCI